MNWVIANMKWIMIVSGAQVGLSIGVDLVMVMLFIGYLIGVRRAQSAV